MIYNPPIMVPDGTYRDEVIEKLGGGTQTIKSPNFVENPEEALYQVLEQAVAATGKKNQKIVPQKIGRTTSIFYPNDGWTQYEGPALSWTGIRNASGNSADASDVTRYVVAATAGTSSNKFINLRRGIFVFYTDAIPDTDQVTGTTMSVVAVARGDHDLINERFLNITVAATSGDGNAVPSDYELQNQYDIALSDDKSIMTDIPVDGSTYANWQFNNEGLLNVNRSGYSKFGLRFVEDIYGNDMTWNAGYNYGLSIRLSETSGSTLDPKLVVEHGVPLVAPTTTVIQNINYTYDAVDNITQIADQSSTLAAKIANFTYDDLNRLTRASTTAASSTPYVEQYSYNAIGNLLSKTGQGTYTYAGTGFANPHAPTAIGTSTLTYNQNGVLATHNGATYTSNYKSQITAYTKNATTTKYTYDHLGQRLEKARGTGTTTYATAAYEVSPGNSITKYIYANGDLIATIKGTGATTTPSYIHRDHLSSTNVTTNQSGAISTVLDYYPYGGTRVETGTPPARQYIGQYDDQESDLAYLNARYYDSGRGQFTSQDPVFWEVAQTPDGIRVLTNPQAQNSYSYAGNSPIGFKDPSGRAYGEVSFGGEILFFNASFGLRVDGKGVDGFVSVGPSLGLSLPVQASFSSGNLDHERKVTVSRSAEFMFGPGMGISEEGDYNKEKPFSTSKNKTVTYSASAGLGAGVSQKYTISVPILSFDSGSKNQSPTRNTSSSFSSSNSNGGYQNAFRALNDARKALERGDINSAKAALNRANNSLDKQKGKKK
jgi:RHS repeat-associated protein